MMELNTLAQHPPVLVGESAQKLYRKTLQAFCNAEEVSSVKNHNSVGSAWGMRERPTKELRYATLVLENPQNRLVQSPFFLLGKVVPRTILATLSDEIDVETMAFYDPKALEFSDDNKTIPTNYGYRIRHFNGINQIDLVIEQLRKDPNSRRAVIHIHTVEDAEKKYDPCINSIHFLIRNGALACQTFWRSENALTLLPVNIFEFTMLQELIASELELPLGPYVHVVTSLHYYADDELKLKKTLEMLETEVCFPMEAMPLHSLSQVAILRDYEKKWRLESSAESCEGLSQYWQELGRIIYRSILLKKSNSDRR